MARAGVHRDRLVLRSTTCSPVGRRAIEKEMLAGKWRVRRLVWLIRKQYGRRRQGHQPPTMPSDVPDACVQLLALTTRWRHWCDRLSAQPEESDVFGNCRARLRQRMAETDKTMKALGKTAERAL